MRDGKLNICFNALDRHLDKKGSQVCNYGVNMIGKIINRNLRGVVFSF